MKKRFSVLAAAAILSLAACTSAKEYVPPETMEWRRNGEKITLTLDSSHDVSSTSTAANGIVFQSVLSNYKAENDDRYTFMDDVFFSYHSADSVSAYKANSSVETDCMPVTEQFLVDAGIDLDDYEFSGFYKAHLRYEYEALSTDAEYGSIQVDYLADGTLDRVSLSTAYPADVKPPAGDVSYFERELKKHLKKIDYADYQILDQTVRYGRRGKFLLAIYEITFWDGEKNVFETIPIARKKLF